MTVAYFDARALVKLVIEERGSEEAALLWDGADAVVTSRVAHPEVRAALAAAHRDGRLDATAHRRAKAEWGAFHPALRMVELTPQLEREAADLAEQHALSGFDAVHLASALTLAELPVVVATWDPRLLRAAQSLGLETLPARLRPV
jgi:predicted nucleic acid-binding protein